MKIISSIFTLGITLAGMSSAFADAGNFPSEPIYIPPEIYAQHGQPQVNPRSPQDILIGPVENFNFNVDINVAPAPTYSVNVPRPAYFNDPNLSVGPSTFNPRQPDFSYTGPRPINPNTFQWHTRGANESFEWYLANVAGLVYPQQNQGVVADLNGDGLSDRIYIVEVNPGGYYDARYQFVSVWINYGRDFEVKNDLVEGLYAGIQVDRGRVFLIEERLGRLSYTQYFP